MSYLTDKSDALQQAAALLHEKGLHPAAAHPAYYCCYQLMMHIWLHSMKKTPEELTRRRNPHEALIAEIGGRIEKSAGKDSAANFRAFYRKIWELKELRISADYSNAPFDVKKSARALRLSSVITSILKKY
jgi:hypothetical protein